MFVGVFSEEAAVWIVPEDKALGMSKGSPGSTEG